MTIQEIIDGLPSGFLAISKEEAKWLYILSQLAANMKGDMAEVGVYRGGSARIIAEAKKNLYLFDTFEGLPQPGEHDTQEFKKGDYLGTIEEVQSMLKDLNNVFLIKGLFPKTGKKIKNKRFCFVHLDADLYQSTLDSINFFWPRMTKGGIILLHDYQNSPVIKKATESLENPIEIKGTTEYGFTNSYGFFIK
jgi:predicted O-methyltransferase YrrM